MHDKAQLRLIILCAAGVYLAVVTLDVIYDLVKMRRDGRLRKAWASNPKCLIASIVATYVFPIIWIMRRFAPTASSEIGRRFSR